MDARIATIETRRGLAGSFAGDEKSARRPGKDQQFPATIAREWSRRSLLFALSKAGQRRPGAGRDPLYRNPQAGTVRSAQRPECSAQPCVFNPSAAIAEVRTPNFLRS